MAGDFELARVPVPTPGAGQVLTRTIYLSLDPYMRGRMNAETSYAAPVPIGGVMEGGAVSVVEASKAEGLAVGDIVVGRTGWQDYAVSDGAGLRKVDPGGGPDLDRGRRARHAGHDRLYRAAQHRPAQGGRDAGRCRRLRRGRQRGRPDRQDQGLPRRRRRGRAGEMPLRARTRSASTPASTIAPADFEAQLAAACPKGIDIYFENVGGRVLEAVIPLLTFFSRMPVCGLIAHYNMTTLPDGPNRLPQLMRAVLTNRVRIQGFIVSDFADQQADFLRDMGQWVRDGRVKYREHRVKGLENAPATLIGLLKGENFGKVVVEVSDDPTQSR